jgi:hypothetical protein
MTLINELLDAIESNPSSIEARVLLLQQWIAAGWNDAAVERCTRFAPA